MLLTTAQPPSITSPVSSAAGLPQAIVPLGFGVNIHFTSAPDAELQRLKDGGFGLARMDLAWRAVETKPGVYDFGAWDTLTAELDSVYIRPLYILDYTNPLYDNDMPVHSDAGISAFASFCAAAASHFRGRRVIYEIWNEPNGGFWKSTPDPDDYAKMAIAAARAMRRADPDATIIAPAASGIPMDYLGRVFQDGLLDQIDAVSVHPYRPGAPESVVDDYAKLRALISQYSHGRDVPIVCSEWGYSSCTHAVTEEEQAAFLAREWLVNLSCGVDLSIFYDWKDDGADPGNWEDRYGTVRQDMTPKPAYEEAKSLIDALRGYRFVKRLDTGESSHWKLLFSTGDRLAVAEWDTAEDTSTTAAIPTVTVYTTPAKDPGG